MNLKKCTKEALSRAVESTAQLCLVMARGWSQEARKSLARSRQHPEYEYHWNSYIKFRSMRADRMRMLRHLLAELGLVSRYDCGARWEHKRSQEVKP